MTDAGENASTSLFSSLPLLRDSLQTVTTKAQASTVQSCLPYLNGVGHELSRNSHGIPALDREDHEAFLRDTLEGESHQAFDSQRPWLVYWNLAALSILGADTKQYGDKVIQLFETLQNKQGGIAGGCAIIGPTALDCFDRKSLWNWLGSCKQSDGGFSVAIGAEEDIRGAYCAMTTIAILNLPLELPHDAPARAAGLTSFTDKLPEWLSKCQSYEGGIGGAPGNEAHGAYTFCGLACASILGSPKDILPKLFNMPTLIHWLVSRQYAPEGGFSGRTNKLVDGCYSHWVGGCWPIIMAAMGESTQEQQLQRPQPGLYHRESLMRYITTCCQQPEGGLRDKPQVYPDSYHSCYVLGGLSSAQHLSQHESMGDGEAPLDFAFQWKAITSREHPLQHVAEFVGTKNIVEPVHPIFVVPYKSVEQARAWALAR